MKVIIIGKSGQLANELVEEASKNVSLLCIGRNDIDITSYDELTMQVMKFSPDLIINASAYTAVDKAETDTEAAFAINQFAVENMAKIAKLYNIRLLHISTDFVFDGDSNKAYNVLSQTNPVSVYGASKFAGEEAIKSLYSGNSTIVRTSWVYSAFGNNFVKTMLRLMSEKSELSVVVDQIGCPTYAKGLAQFLWTLSEKKTLEAVYHWCDSGVASWYDFAIAIQDISVELGLLDKKIPIKAISSSEYPTPAKRPTFSLLNTNSSVNILAPSHWREQLIDCLNRIQRIKD